MLNAFQLLGLLVLLTGIYLLYLSYHLTPSWVYFDSGIVCILLFLCVPSFALTSRQNRLFYEAFPMLKQPLNKIRHRHLNRLQELKREKEERERDQQRSTAAAGSTAATAATTTATPPSITSLFSSSSSKGTYDAHASSLA